MPGQDADIRRFSFGNFVLDIERGSLSRDGLDVKLRPKSFEVLRYLVENSGRLVGKSELMEAVWGRTVVTEGSMTQCIIDIRRAMGDDGSRLLRTVPRRGFIFEGRVSILRTATEATSSATDDGIAQAVPAMEPRSEPAIEAPLPGRWQRWQLPMLAALGLLALAGGWWWMHDDREEGSAGQSAARAVDVPSNSIAVLRFLDLSPDQNQAYLADGLSEEILHLLAQSRDLLVIARSSSFVFEPGEADIATIARRLGVAYVLEGSVRRDGDRLRIAAQLIDAATSAHVWSRSYDRNSRDLLTLQREIAADVARTLKASLVVDAAGSAPANPHAEDLHLHARYLFQRRGPGDLEAAETNVRRAIEIDPGHARAWTLLAGVLQIRAAEDPAGPEMRLEEMGQALERALDIDPMLPEAHARMAAYQRWVRGDRAAADAAFARAVELAPDDPLVLGHRWSRAVRDGRLDEALAISRRSVAADPLSAVTRHNAAIVLFAAGQLEQGLAELYRARELNPGDSRAGVEISRALLLLGRLDEARREAATVEDGLDRDQLRVLLETDGAAYARLESEGSARSLLLLAEIAAFQGDTEAAFRRLAMLTSRPREPGPIYPLAVDTLDAWGSPFLRSLREDPRWEMLVAQMR